jgi:hypothetical protein
VARVRKLTFGLYDPHPQTLETLNRIVGRNSRNRVVDVAVDLRKIDPRLARARAEFGQITGLLDTVSGGNECFGRNAANI